MINTSFLDTLKKFSLIVQKRVTSPYSGQKLSTVHGRGMTFKDYRIYALGDDFRTIDWKVFARTDDLYIKTFEEERNLNVHILVDSSGSMNFGHPLSKFDYASMIGVGFAYLSLLDNEKVQFATFSDGLQIFPSRRGMYHIASMVDHVNSITPSGKTQFLETLRQYKRYIGSRSLIVIVSDLLYDPKEIEDALLLLGKHDIKLIQVLDTQEKNLTMEGDFKLKDAESSDILRTYISPRLRQQYTKMMEDHVARITDICNPLGVSFYQVTSDKQIFDTFYELLKR